MKKRRKHTTKKAATTRMTLTQKRSIQKTNMEAMSTQKVAVIMPLKENTALTLPQAPHAAPAAHAAEAPPKAKGKIRSFFSHFAYELPASILRPNREGSSPDALADFSRVAGHLRDVHLTRESGNISVVPLDPKEAPPAANDNVEAADHGHEGCPRWRTLDSSNHLNCLLHRLGSDRMSDDRVEHLHRRDATRNREGCLCLSMIVVASGPMV